MYKVIFSIRSEKQLEEIVYYIGLDNLEKAKSFTLEMKNFFINRLIQLPLSGRKIKGDVRMLPYKRYGILYVVDESLLLVKVLHIFSGGQDWEEWV
jgi:plasmid stabilization system protein ParE